MQQKKSAVFYTEYIFHSDVDKLYLKDCRITLNVYDYICQKDRVWDVSLCRAHMEKPFPLVWWKETLGLYEGRGEGEVLL